MKEQIITKKFEGYASLLGIQAEAAISHFNESNGSNLMRKGGMFSQRKQVAWVGFSTDCERARNFLLAKLTKEGESLITEFKRLKEDLLTYVLHVPQALKEIDEVPSTKLVEYAKDTINKAQYLLSKAYFTDWFGYEAYNWFTQKFGEIDVDIFRTVTMNRELSFSKRLEYAIAQCKVNKTNNYSEIHNKFFWARDSYSKVHFLTEEKIKDEVLEMTIKEAEGIIKFVEEVFPIEVVQAEKVLEELNIPEEAKRVLRSFGFFVDLQDVRKEAIFVTNNIAFSIFKKLLTQKGIDENMHEEIMSVCDYKWIIGMDKDELLDNYKKAKNGYLILANEKPLFGDEAVNKYEQIVETDLEEDLKGQVASNGVVSGAVVVIKTTEDFSKVQDGDILVTSMTRPDMVPIMNKAAGFITDEGGITCHAAIIAREMKKPCIIGTKITTQVLKDGMEVKVDADKGIVKIIK